MTSPILKNFVSLLTVFFLISLAACGADSSQGSGSGFAPVSADQTIIQDEDGLRLTVSGGENEDCKVVGVDSESVALDGNGSVGFNLDLSADYATNGEGSEDAAPETIADEEVFELYDTEGNLLDADFDLAAEFHVEFPGPIFEVTSRGNLFFTGLSNPTSDTDYAIVLPAGSIHCADDEVTTADYQIDFTLVATSTENSADSTTESN